MYKVTKPSKTTLSINASYEGETIENKIDRIVNNNEPITDSAPLIYTERKNGVEPQYNIRTDVWDIAVEKMNHVAQAHIARRQDRIDKKDPKKSEKPANPADKPANGGTESTQGTN